MSHNNGRKAVSRRNFLRMAAGLGGVGLLSACGGVGAPSGGAPAAGGEAPAAGATTAPAAGGTAQTTIEVWFWDDALGSATAGFEKANPDIKVDFKKLTYADTHQKLLTSLAAGSGAPDVCAIEIGKVGSFAGKGGLVDMTSGAFADGKKYKADMVEYKWVQGSTADGRVIAMPWDVGPAGLWYRVDLFQAAGLETDPEKLQAQVKTWDDWFEIGKQLKAKTPNVSIMADAGNEVFTALVEQKGHGWFRDGKTVIVEKGTPALQKAVEVRKNKIDADVPWWGADWKAAMEQNTLAGMIIACWMQGGLSREHPKTAGQWRVIHAPEGDFNWGGSFLSIPEQSKKQEAAWKYVQYICCTPEGQNTIFKASGIYPAYKPAWKDPIYDQPVDFFGGQRTYRIWLDISDKVPSNLVHPNDQEAGDIVGAEVTKAMKEGKDPAQAMKDAQDTLIKQVPGISA